MTIPGVMKSCKHRSDLNDCNFAKQIKNQLQKILECFKLICLQTKGTELHCNSKNFPHLTCVWSGDNKMGSWMDALQKIKHW
jgi:hypothetical protein